MTDRAVALLAAILAGSAMAELLQAAGTTAPGGVLDGVATTAGVLAALVAIGAVALPVRSAAFLPAAAAAFLVAHWVAYDPYYAPGRRRASDGGLEAAVWVVPLAVVAVALSALIARQPRARFVAVPVLFLVAASSLGVRAGH